MTTQYNNKHFVKYLNKSLPKKSKVWIIFYKIIFIQYADDSIFQNIRLLTAAYSKILGSWRQHISNFNQWIEVTILTKICLSDKNTDVAGGNFGRRIFGVLFEKLPEDRRPRLFRTFGGGRWRSGRLASEQIRNSSTLREDIGKSVNG